SHKFRVDHHKLTYDPSDNSCDHRSNSCETIVDSDEPECSSDYCNNSHESHVIPHDAFDDACITPSDSIDHTESPSSHPCQH
ncbi:hypothetical protein BG006_001832, partial [Podila minutissima]